jgi:ABC-type transport system involved in multi-copper enzyme maturation permease subunit
MIALTSAELGKLFRRSMVWRLALVMGAVMAGLAVAVALSAPPESGVRPSALELAVPIGLIGCQVLAALAGAAMGQEYQWRTLPLWLARGARRGPLLAARFVAALPALVLVAAVPLTVGLAFSLGDLEAALRASHLTVPTLWLAVVATVFAALPYLALALGLAVLRRSAVAPVVGVLLLALLVEPVVGQLAPRLGAYLPAALAANLVAGGGPGRLLAASLILVYSAVLVAAAVTLFRSQDLTG